MFLLFTDPLNLTKSPAQRGVASDFLKPNLRQVFPSLEETVFNFSENESHLDMYKMFKTKMFTVTGTKWADLSQSRQVCLGTQTSIDRLYWLPEMVKTWSGPISLTLFVPSIEYHISKVYLRYIRQCFLTVKEQVNQWMGEMLPRVWCCEL